MRHQLAPLMIQRLQKVLKLVLPQFGINIILPFAVALFSCVDNHVFPILDAWHLPVQHSQLWRVGLIILE